MKKLLDCSDCLFDVEVRIVSVENIAHKVPIHKVYFSNRSLLLGTEI